MGEKAVQEKAGREGNMEWNGGSGDTAHDSAFTGCGRRLRYQSWTSTRSNTHRSDTSFKCTEQYIGCKLHSVAIQEARLEDVPSRYNLSLRRKST